MPHPNDNYSDKEIRHLERLAKMFKEAGGFETAEGQHWFDLFWNACEPDPDHPYLH